MRAAIESGEGARVFERMIEAQGGDAAVVSDPSLLPTAPHAVEVVADAEGVVTRIDALEIGLTGVAMGAGRTRADQAVDHAVGIELCCERGEAVAAGDPLAILHVHDPSETDAWATRVRGAFDVDPDAPQEERGSVVMEAIRSR
jgi:pyrimidine-nucleoside phosphorylase